MGLRSPYTSFQVMKNRSRRAVISDISVACNSIAPPFPRQDVLCILIACRQRTEIEEDARALV